jgi:type IV fimbrial biogenesis protein FimT
MPRPGYCKPGQHCPDQSGFSILELALCLVLLAVVTAMALPSFVDMMEKRRLSHDAENILSFIQKAQSESIKRNQVMTISYTRASDEEWCLGAVLGSGGCDCTVSETGAEDFCSLDSNPSLTGSGMGNYTSLMRSMSGDGVLRLDPVRGMALDAADTLALDLRSPSENYRLRLNVSNTGLTELCSQDTNHQTPGYDLCL